MAAKNISFNNLSLQNDTYKTENINYRHLGEKQIQKKPDTRTGGFDISETKYTQKVITVTGTIYGNDKADLRSAVDNLKEKLSPEEKNLDIDYGNKTIRYEATVQSIEVPEERWHITQLPFTIEFLTQPWATSTASTLKSWTSITNTTFTNSINIDGSYNPSPTIKVTSNKSIDTTVKFTNDTTGDWIETKSTQSFSTNSVLEVDTDAETVKLDGSNIDFAGVFPVFNPNTNSVTVTTTGSPDYYLEIEYFPTYL